jgi:hypothetical protein
MTNPAEQSAPQPEVAHLGLETDEEFTVELPSQPGDRVRHVVWLRGDQLAFTDAYQSFVDARSPDAEPLFVSAEQRDLVSIREVLDSLGGATVERIDAARGD